MVAGSVAGQQGHIPSKYGLSNPAALPIPYHVGIFNLLSTNQQNPKLKNKSKFSEKHKEQDDTNLIVYRRWTTPTINSKPRLSQKWCRTFVLLDAMRIQ